MLLIIPYFDWSCKVSNFVKTDIEKIRMTGIFELYQPATGN